MDAEARDRLQARCDAEKAAKAAIELLNESATGNLEYYWQVVRDEALRKCPLKAKENRQLEAMADDSEIARFEVTRMPFGKYVGVVVGSVPAEYLDYLVGMDDDHQKFKKDLKRYLLSREVKDHVAEKIPLNDEEDDGEMASD